MTSIHVYVDSSSAGPDAARADYEMSTSCMIVAEQGAYTVSDVIVRQRHTRMEAFDLEIWGLIETIRWVTKQDSDNQYTVINDSTGSISCLQKLLRRDVGTYTLPLRHPSLSPTERELRVWKDMITVGMLKIQHAPRSHRMLRLCDRVAHWSRTARSSAEGEWVNLFDAIVKQHSLKWASSQAKTRAVQQTRMLNMTIRPIKERALERLELNADPITFDQLVNGIIERQLSVAFS